MAVDRDITSARDPVFVFYMAEAAIEQETILETAAAQDDFPGSLPLGQEYGGTSQGAGDGLVSRGCKLVCGNVVRFQSEFYQVGEDSTEIEFQQFRFVFCR